MTIGFHRLFTHRSFEAKPWLRATLAILGSMSVQGAVIHWVADHRKHHTFTDEEGDPHSPHTHDAQGWRGVLTGLWHSHMGWLFDGERSSARRFAPDLRKDPLIRKIDSLFPVWALLGLAIPFARRLRPLRRFNPIAGADRVRVGRPRARLPAAPRDVERQLDLPHVRQAAVRDRGREPQQLGSSRSSRSARAGTTPTTRSRRRRSTASSRAQFDPSYALIRLFERLGWATNVKRPKPEQIEAKRRRRRGPRAGDRAADRCARGLDEALHVASCSVMLTCLSVNTAGRRTA